ncbi:hypothetical protein D3C84_1255180 [compost metagenome]
MTYRECTVTQPAPGKILVQCHYSQAAMWLSPDVPSRFDERRPCNDGACTHATCPLYDNAWQRRPKT